MELEMFSANLKTKQIKDIIQEETTEGLLLKGIPVFESGTYRGKKYDNSFLDDNIIRNFKVDEDVPVQANHSDNTFDTLGYVKSLKREDTILFADLLLIDDNAITRWKKKLMKKFSISLYPEGFGEPIGKLREISFVPFPRIKGAVVHSEEKMSTEEESEWGKFKAWSGKQRNDLPDSAFLLVKHPVKDKAADRALPVRNTDGDYDEAHVRNAMARMNQVQDFSAEEIASARKKLKAIAKKLGITVSADFNEVEDIKLEEVENMAVEKDAKQLLEEFAEKEVRYAEEKATLVKEKSDLDAKFKEKEAELVRLSAELETFKKDKKEMAIKSKIEEFKKVGKVIPAQEEVMKAHMMTLDDEGLKKFTEVIEKSTPTVKFEETTQQATTKTEGTKVDIEKLTAKEILAAADVEAKKTGRDFWTCYNEMFLAATK